MFLAEVADITGNVGTAVKTCRTLIEAVRFVAETTKERWAGDWRIKHAGTGIVILTGRNL